jgi:hypothetical protein
MAKKIIFAIIGILIVIQFIRPDKNINASQQVNNIKTKYQMPDTVNKILSIACYDCHSNNTRYPWYNNIQPVAWWLDSHIKDGKKHFNFDEFTTYSLKRQDHKLEELIESQKDHWMPLENFKAIHQDARLSNAQSKLLIDWANETRKVIQANPEFAVSPTK